MKNPRRFLFAALMSAALASVLLGCSGPEPADTSMIVDKSQAPSDAGGTPEPSSVTSTETDQSSEGS